MHEALEKYFCSTFRKLKSAFIKYIYIIHKTFIIKRLKLYTAQFLIVMNMMDVSDGYL